MSTSRLWMAFALAVVVVAWLGCGRKADETPGPVEEESAVQESGSPLIGAWKIVEATGVAADTNIGIVYKFRPDGKLIVAGGFEQEFAYRTEGDTLHWELNENFKLNGRFEIEGDRMTLSLGTSDQIFVMQKQ